jgi:Asp-tRNA(Asn)/Glu-tRNA(Gln) amidotransferase A subunit family amidase
MSWQVQKQVVIWLDMMGYNMVRYFSFLTFSSDQSIYLFYLGSYVKPVPGTMLGKTSNVYAQTRSAGFGLEVQKRILLGTYSLTAE